MSLSAEGFSYGEIAGRNSDAGLSPQQVAEAKMQGECPVGLKDINFKKKDDFDPVAEWTSYRSISLMEQVQPCEVPIMMEVARTELLKRE
ncbi:hypothetical protein PN836_004000 [Ningiella sp. W23]|uniref:hypothetical protein n=1 Tax=Ningiella sp. W23 TaxID=3023715 RepID=UPI0037563723